MGNILTDIQEKYRHGSICLKFIYINIGIFIATYILNLIFLLFNTPLTIWRWFELPADILTFLRQPWSIITYMFMHANLLHLAFVMAVGFRTIILNIRLFQAFSWSLFLRRSVWRSVIYTVV